MAYDVNECESWPNIPVTVIPRFDQPSYNYNVNLNQVQALANNPKRSVHGGHHGITLGLTQYEPIIQFVAPMKGIKMPNGLACAHVEHLEATIGYKNVVIYIPREVPQGSCGFDQVMAHEQKHIEVNRQILVEYTPRIQQKLQEYLKINGVFKQIQADYAEKLLNERLQAILNETAMQVFTENSRRQQLVDTAEEYRRVNSMCNGQLGKTATHYMQQGR
ncbi:MAG: hypothetical protein WAO98_08290 [Alphaproteobacteria bacterium]